jgi:hypothetical protein
MSDRKSAPAGGTLGDQLAALAPGPAIHYGNITLKINNVKHDIDII